MAKKYYAFYEYLRKAYLEGSSLLLDGEKRRLESTCTLEGGESGGGTGDSVMGSTITAAWTRMQESGQSGSAGQFQFPGSCTLSGLGLRKETQMTG